MPAIALIVTDLENSWLGLPAQLGDELAGRCVLAHTVARAARVRQVEKVVIVHPQGQDPADLLGDQTFGKPVDFFACEAVDDRHLARWVAARKWALACWRGGLGTATGYDELLPAEPLLAAMDAHDAGSALLVRGDWCFFDTAFAESQLAMHLEHPEAFTITFTQAPPGLSGMVASRQVLAQLSEHRGAFGQALGYNPAKAALDPIGREVNHPIPPEVRDTYRRFVYDTPRSMALMRAVAQELGSGVERADAQAVVAAARDAERHDPDLLFGRLPQQVTLELTPRRGVSGLITPQHYVPMDRPDMDPDLALRIVEQLADPDLGGDVALRLGGLGDALEHSHWRQIVMAAKDAGVLGICLETDLLCERQVIDDMLALPVDVISIRLNADTSETYQAVMGVDGFNRVAGNLEYLFNQRRRLSGDNGALLPGMPWIVPRLVKIRETLKDMESFFDRWMTATGHAVIEPAQSGCGLMPELSPVPMAPPRRRACRQLGWRMTILSDGGVALCDQDWQGNASLGQAGVEPIVEIWQRVAGAVSAHAAGRFDEPALCAGCSEWHRP